jgi:ATP synthase protein I
MSNPGNGSSSGDGQEHHPGELSPEQREAFRRRAEALGKRLGEVKARKVPMSEAESRARGSALGQAFKIAVELVAGVAVGGMIGWFLDGWLGTKPWLLVVFLMLGFAAGMLNVIRTAKKMQARAEPMQRAAPSVKDGEDD